MKLLKTARTIAGYMIPLFFVLMIGNIGAAEQSTTGAEFWTAIIWACVNLLLLGLSVLALEVFDA